MATLRSPRGLLLCETEGGPILVFADDSIIGRSISTAGHFGESKINEVLSVLADHGLNPRCFVDIGANIGTHTLFALDSGRFERAIAIEADPDNFLLLTANIAMRGHGDRSRLVHCALSDTVGQVELELCSSNFGDHRVRVPGVAHSRDLGETARETRLVPADLADHVLGSNLHWPDVLVWMDTQGHEGQILNGATNTLASRANAVVTEFWPYGLQRAGGKDRYFDFLFDVDVVYDINQPEWPTRGKVLVPNLLDTYETMLRETAVDHYPHTDLLCLRLVDSTAQGPDTVTRAKP